MDKMKMFEIFGFSWNREIVPKNIPNHPQKVIEYIFKKAMYDFVYDASVAEDNPLTFVEVKTVMDGFTVGGHKLSDQEQIINLKKACNELLNKISDNRFSLTKEDFCSFNNLIAFEESLEWGHFRGEGEVIDVTPYVSLGELGRHEPIQTEKDAPLLNNHFERAISSLNSFDNSLEKSLVFFLYGALQQFFFDGNKRSSRFMMNGILMSSNSYPISVPAKNVQEYNEKMVRFYKGKNADEMIAFLVNCHQEAKVIKKLNPVELSNPKSRNDSDNGSEP